jgi:hypothetical protein
VPHGVTRYARESPTHASSTWSPRHSAATAVVRPACAR